MAVKSREQGRIRRHARVREKVRGSAARPRLAVYRSLSQIYGQLIDDVAGKTLVAASSLDAKDTKQKKSERANAEGKALGERAKAKGITEVVFDRGGYRYHGRVKALAEGVRAAGVKV
jgi:large subunit ribosomal protein L18